MQIYLIINTLNIVSNNMPRVFISVIFITKTVIRRYRIMSLYITKPRNIVSREYIEIVIIPNENIM